MQYIFDIANLFQILSNNNVNGDQNLLNYNIKCISQIWHVTELVKNTLVHFLKSFLLPNQTKYQVKQKAIVKIQLFC